MTIPGLVCLLIAVAFAETLWNRATGGRMLPWTTLMHREDESPAAPPARVNRSANSAVLRKPTR